MREAILCSEVKSRERDCEVEKGTAISNYSIAFALVTQTTLGIQIKIKWVPIVIWKLISSWYRELSLNELLLKGRSIRERTGLP